MLFPIGTSEPIRREAWCTYAIILVTVVCFGLFHEKVLVNPEMGFVPDGESPILLDYAKYRLQPQEWMPLKFFGFKWYQLLTYQLAHGGMLHLAMNMVFLFAFGRPLESKLGHLRFLAVYLVGGVVAGLGHIATSAAPVIGASGAVCAVSGMFLALLPNATVRVVYFFIFTMGVMEVNGMTMILGFFCLDLIMTVLSIRSEAGSFGVAYTAHLSGSLFGLGVGLLMLKFKIIPTSHNDLLHMINQYRRRQEMRRVTQSGYQPWLSGNSTGAAGAGTPTSPEKEEVMRLRSQINHKAHARDFDGACELYLKLLAQDPAQVMPRQTQHDMANHYFSQQKYAESARAYEKFLETYKTDADRDQVQLMLTLIYLRYLKDREKARACLDEVSPRLVEEDHKQLAAGLAEELAGG